KPPERFRDGRQRVKESAPEHQNAEKWLNHGLDIPNENPEGGQKQSAAGRKERERKEKQGQKQYRPRNSPARDGQPNQQRHESNQAMKQRIKSGDHRKNLQGENNPFHQIRIEEDQRRRT